ncbi:thioredoxin family protein [Chloracidobacterium validum]|uniref:Thioredoxin family protein n=1 Tax=Chloracidobacterium validum TaxID=2821543 RepID=A0ABX8B6P4_9BACT|nr:thioredoxin family protein [Chloracidobacterium validum]QUW02633.1 thioredoxin family protein [Chloracidobacterium validum]
MALTPSTMLALGTPAPDFTLTDVTTGRAISLATFADRPVLLVMFICRHCPYVKHVEKALTALANEYLARGVGVLAISSNDAAAYPDDAPESLRAMARELGFQFPYGYDESQEVAKAFQAACTPDFFVYDRARALVYRGQMDDSRPGNGVPVTGSDLRRALDAALAGEPPLGEQKPSIGCNIKWRPGNAPAYA